MKNWPSTFIGKYKIVGVIVFLMVLSQVLLISSFGLVRAWNNPAQSPPAGGGLLTIDAAGNLKLPGASPAYRITNVASPTAGSDVATKSYVDAQVGGGGTLKVYKSDGTTLLGILAGVFYQVPKKCSGWGYWLPEGGLRVLDDSDCAGEYWSTAFYYPQSNCSGYPVYTSYGYSYYYQKDGVNFGVSPSSSTTNVNCVNSSGTTSLYSIQIKSTPLCGSTGYCIVK
jgi:hypothetical protein